MRYKLQMYLATDNSICVCLKELVINLKIVYNRV